MATLEQAQASPRSIHQVVELTDFEQEVLEVLQLEGPVEEDATGERTLCEQFGFANAECEKLYRALRQLIKVGLVRQLDGAHNAMRNCKRFRFSRGRVIYVAA